MVGQREQKNDNGQSRGKENKLMEGQREQKNDNGQSRGKENKLMVGQREQKNGNGQSRISRKRRGKRFKVEHKESPKLGISALSQAGQVQCDNGPKNISVWQSY